jgi:hypothetical protein
MKILAPTGTQTPTPRSSSQSLHRLRYPGSFLNITDVNVFFISPETFETAHRINVIEAETGMLVLPKLPRPEKYTACD